MSYATPADLLKRFDARQVGDLVSDTDVAVPPGQLTLDPVLLQMLEDASGEIEVALLSGQRYTLDDIAVIMDPETTVPNSQAYLKRICCEIAYVMLLKRRGIQDPEKIKAQVEAAETHLERLRRGDTVFQLPAQIAAGVAEFSGVGTVDFTTLHLPFDRSRNYFPRRPIQDGK